MTDNKTTRSRPLGQTTGTEDRPPQHVVGTVLTFKLDEELKQLQSEQAWKTEDHNAKTLVKDAHDRVVLVALKRGARLPEHRAPSDITVQTLRGHLHVHADGQTIDLPVGSLLALAGGIPHDVEALDESAFLLTLAWPEQHRAETSLPFQATAPEAEKPLDVRAIPPAQRHALIFQTYAELGSGAGFILINDHDPKPLYYQLKFEHDGQFTWDYLEQGPQTWRVRIGKPS